MERERTVRRPAMSFIVRVWPDDGPALQMRGEVEHIATGEKRLFIDQWSLMHLLESWKHDIEVAS